MQSVVFMNEQKELEKECRKLGKEKGVKFVYRGKVTATDHRKEKYYFRNWSETYEFISTFEPDAPEIFSPKCCFSSTGGEEVSVKLSDCPIERKEWKHTWSPMFGRDKDKEFEMTTCFYRSDFHGTVIPKCQYYQGCKEVKRDGYRQYKVLCTAPRQ